VPEDNSGTILFNANGDRDLELEEDVLFDQTDHLNSLDEADNDEDLNILGKLSYYFFHILP